MNAGLKLVYVGNFDLGSGRNVAGVVGIISDNGIIHLFIQIKAAVVIKKLSVKQINHAVLLYSRSAQILAEIYGNLITSHSLWCFRQAAHWEQA